MIINSSIMIMKKTAFVVQHRFDRRLSPPSSDFSQNVVTDVLSIFYNKIPLQLTLNLLKYNNLNLSYLSTWFNSIFGFLLLFLKKTQRRFVRIHATFLNTYVTILEKLKYLRGPMLFRSLV